MLYFVAPEYADYKEKSEESYPLGDLIRHVTGDHLRISSQNIISTVYPVNRQPGNGE